MTKTKDDLLYVGDGAYLNGVPARDLTSDEIEARDLKVADLLASGLYAKPPKTPDKGKE